MRTCLHPCACKHAPHLVRLGLRLSHVLAQRGDVQHASARAHHLARSVARGARMEHLGGGGGGRQGGEARGGGRKGAVVRWQ